MEQLCPNNSMIRYNARKRREYWKNVDKSRSRCQDYRIRKKLGLVKQRVKHPKIIIRFFRPIETLTFSITEI